MRRTILGSNQTFLISGTVSKSHRILLSVEETLQGDNSRIDFFFFRFPANRSSINSTHVAVKGTIPTTFSPFTNVGKDNN